MKSCVSRSMATSFAAKFATGGVCNAWSLTWLNLKSCHMAVINVPLKICFWHCWLLCRWHRVIKMCVSHPPSGIKQIMGNCYTHHMTLSIDFDIEWQELHHDWSFHAHNEKCVYWCSVNLVNKQISKYPGLFHRGCFIGDCKFIKPFKMRFIWISQKFRFSDGIQQVEAFHIPGLHVAGLVSWGCTTSGNIRKMAGQSGKTNLPMTSFLLRPNGHTSWGLLKLLSLNSPLWEFWSCRILLYIRLITLIFDR